MDDPLNGEAPAAHHRQRMRERQAHESFIARHYPEASGAQ
jgi:hypothetical protein